MATVRMNAAAIGGTIYCQNTGPVTVPSDGIITVDSRDAAQLLLVGASYINARTGQATITTPAAATAARLVASTALSNGTKTIANQPDVPRPGALRIDPGGGTITAGNVALTYTANDGTTQVDNLSAITTALFTQGTSKGIISLTSVITTGIVGGTSPLMQVDTTAALSVPVDPGFVDFAILRENVDGTSEGQVAVASSAASFTPSTAPNATHSYGVFYGYTMPNT
jgi:hypothetical protein